MRKRFYSRKKWKNILKLRENENGYIKPKWYKKIRKYENRKRKISNSINHRNRIENDNPHNKTMIPLPEIIDLFTNDLNGINKFIKNKNNFLKHPTVCVRLDHSKIKKMSIDGLLFLVSTIENIFKASEKLHKFGYERKPKYNKKYGVEKSDEKIKFLLLESGYWDYFCKKKPYKITTEAKDEYFLSIKTGHSVITKNVADVRDFINSKINFIQTAAIQEYFDDALTEAMANSVEHGYIDNLANKEKNKWWLCGHYDRTDEILEFSFRDYGVGLRRTIEYNADDRLRSWLRGVGNKLKEDSEIIKMLVDEELPKYKRRDGAKRGYGFKKFKEFADNSGHNCDMLIISGNGRYVYHHYDGTSNEKTDTIPEKIDGFLISWKIYLEGGKKDEQQH